MPWPSDDELQADADTVWAIEVGFIDPDRFGGEAADVTQVEELRPSGDLDSVMSRSSVGEAPSADSRVVDTSASDPVALMDELERQARDRHRAIAAEYRLVPRLLAHAVAEPTPWVGPDPTLDGA